MVRWDWRPVARVDAARQAFRTFVGWLREAWSGARHLWRRSLQFRIVSVTLLLSTSLVGAFGGTVAGVITHKILTTKISAAERVVREGGEYATRQLKVVNQPDDPALLSTIPVVVTRLATTPGVSGDVEVVMIRTNRELDLKREQLARPSAAAFETVRSSQLAGLRSMVSGRGGREGHLAYQYVTISPDGGPRREYLAFGTPIASFGGQLELYYLFPLGSEVNQVNLVRSTLVITGGALVILLAMLAALTTRMVVRPVRIAARTAQRLSAGLLDQRIQAKGEDDLARLAAAFNQMAANLQRQIVRLEEMSRLQRRFTSDVSHELRTPLTTVRMAADLIFATRDDFEPAVARSAELLQTELDRFEALLGDLLEISRFDAGFAALDAEPTNLSPIVQSVVERLASLAERAGCSLEVEVPDEPVIIEADGRRVERILRNLVGNAVEHGEGRPVTVTVATDESAVAVTVRDRGIGLRPGEEDLVFNRFWRADPSRARQTGGTGLGLSISLEDARLHGGWLQAWGRPGKGAQFRLTLPIRAGDRLTGSPLPLEPSEVTDVEPGRRSPALSARVDGAAVDGGDAGDRGVA